MDESIRSFITLCSDNENILYISAFLLLISIGLYGTGLETERAYFYKDNTDDYRLNVSIDTSENIDDAEKGVRLGQGDGTVR